ncbi:MAG: hypothetical protein ABSG78_07755 [Verrucomicrobiota bacterium]
MKLPNCLLQLIRFTATCFVCITLFGCQQSEHHIQVQVFLTTQGGSSIKLGAVPICVLDEPTFQKVLGVYNQNTMPGGQRYQIDVNTKAQIADALAKLKAIESKYGSDVNASPQYLGEKLQLVGLVIDWAKERKSNFHTILGNKFEVGRTDADGCLNVTFTKTGFYYVSAKTERLVSNNAKETYLWFVRVNADADRKVQLDNDNLFDIDVDGVLMGIAPPMKVPDYPELH